MIDPNNVQRAWNKGDVRYFLVVVPEMGHYCGYCEFETRPVRETGYHGIVTYVPVHGGITYAEQEPDGRMVYGFDCAHSGDDMDPRCRSESWLIDECEKMALGLQSAAVYEPEYLLAKTDEQKAAIIDAYHAQLKADHGITFEVSDNFNAMINVIFGRL